MRERLEAAINFAQGEYTVDDILAAVQAGEMQLWEFEDDTFVVTMRVVYPRLVRLRVVLLSGNFHDEFYFRVMEIAKAVGAQGMEAFGRPGWERRLRQFGAKPAYTVLVHDWEDGK